MYSIEIGSDYMWDKIAYYAKKIFDWFINAFVYIALLCGYVWFCFEVEKYFTGEFSIISLFVGFFIYGYYIIKQEDKKHTIEHQNFIKQIEKERETLNFARVIYETDYSSLKVIDKITLSGDFYSYVDIFLKTDEKINKCIDNLSWVKTEEQLIKLDKFLYKVIAKEDEAKKTLFNIGSIDEKNIDEYLNN